MFVVTNSPAVLKLVDGDIVYGVAPDSWTPYGIALSDNNDKVIAVGHGADGAFLVLDAGDFTVLAGKVHSSNTLFFDVTSNTLGNWYAVGSKNNQALLTAIS